MGSNPACAVQRDCFFLPFAVYHGDANLGGVVLIGIALRVVFVKVLNQAGPRSAGTAFDGIGFRQCHRCGAVLCAAALKGKIHLGDIGKCPRIDRLIPDLLQLVGSFAGNGVGLPVLVFLGPAGGQHTLIAGFRLKIVTIELEFPIRIGCNRSSVLRENRLPNLRLLHVKQAAFFVIDIDVEALILRGNGAGKADDRLRGILVFAGQHRIGVFRRIVYRQFVVCPIGFLRQRRPDAHSDGSPRNDLQIGRAPPHLGNGDQRLFPADIGDGAAVGDSLGLIAGILNLIVVGVNRLPDEIDVGIALLVVGGQFEIFWQALHGGMIETDCFSIVAGQLILKQNIRIAVAVNHDSSLACLVRVIDALRLGFRVPPQRHRRGRAGLAGRIAPIFRCAEFSLPRSAQNNGTAVMAHIRIVGEVGSVIVIVCLVACQITGYQIILVFAAIVVILGKIWNFDGIAVRMQRHDRIRLPSFCLTVKGQRNLLWPVRMIAVLPVNFRLEGKGFLVSNTGQPSVSVVCFRCGVAIQFFRFDPNIDGGMVLTDGSRQAAEDALPRRWVPRQLCGRVKRLPAVFAIGYSVQQSEVGCRKIGTADAVILPVHRKTVLPVLQIVQSGNRVVPVHFTGGGAGICCLRTIRLYKRIGRGQFIARSRRLSNLKINSHRYTNPRGCAIPYDKRSCLLRSFRIVPQSICEFGVHLKSRARAFRHVHRRIQRQGMVPNAHGQRIGGQVSTVRVDSNLVCLIVGQLFFVLYDF